MFWKTWSRPAQAWGYSVLIAMIVPILFWAGAADIYSRGPTLATMLAFFFIVLAFARASFNIANWDKK